MTKRKLNRGFGVVILAAGKGTRMESDLAKVLHPVVGAPMLTHVLRAALELKPDDVVVIIGHQGGDVKKAHSHFKGVHWVTQKEMRGTGDAVRTAASVFEKFEGPILVLYGDIPGIKVETLRRLGMVHTASQNAVTLLTAELDDPEGYGRILLEPDGSVAKIVEEKDTSEDEKEITEINTGIGIWESKFLFASLKLLKPANKQKEYYLTDVVEMARKAGKTVGRFRAKDSLEILGINSQEDLSEVSRIFYDDKALSLLKAGVTLEDPASTSVEPAVEIGPDTVIGSQSRVRGKTRIAANVKIGANVEIGNSEIHSGVEIKGNVTLSNAKVGSGTVIASNTTVG